MCPHLKEELYLATVYVSLSVKQGPEPCVGVCYTLKMKALEEAKKREEEERINEEERRKRNGYEV